MDSILKIWDWLKGKKTYLSAIAAIITTVVAFMNGAISGLEAIGAIWAAIQTMFIRHGVDSVVDSKKKG